MVGRTIREAMARAVARHYEVLDEVIAARGGVRPLEQGEGDSVVAAFAKAGDALRAACEAQVRLLEEVPGLRVRMALHSGDAQLRDAGNYVGRAIIALCPVARLRPRRPGPGVGRDRGSGCRFAAVGCVVGGSRVGAPARPVASGAGVAVAAPVVAISVSAAAFAGRCVHNLPIPLSSFVGRTAELATVGGLVGQHRLVTLTGSGGCGKTRLALHAAADAGGGSPGWHVVGGAGCGDVG